MGLQLAAAFATLTSCCLAQPHTSRFISAFDEVAPLVIAGGEWTTQIVLTSYRTAPVYDPDLVLRPRRIAINCSPCWSVSRVANQCGHPAARNGFRPNATTQYFSGGMGASRYPLFVRWRLR